MNKNLLRLFYALIMLFSKASEAQDIVNVDPLTGSANIVIPIYKLSIGQVSLPVSISYAGSGVKPKDVEGTAGMGWQLNAGGQISRVLRGLPDDCTNDNSGATMLGWMSSDNVEANYAGSFTITNNGTTCNNGVNDISNINTYIPFNYDTEPDIYYVDAPGLSCQLVYDRGSQKFQPVNYQDIVISYTLFGGTGNNAANITSFTITNDKGVSYLFSAPESVTQTTKLPTGTSTPPNYLVNTFNRYLNGISFYDKWSLVSITDPNGNAIVLNYFPAQARNSTDPIQLYFNGSTTPVTQYTILQKVTAQILNFINTNTNAYTSSSYLSFNWHIPQGTGQTFITSINGMGRSLTFGYSSVPYVDGHYVRSFLTNFIDVGCGTPINYQFGYNGVNVSQGTCALGDSTSNQLDYWGYFSTGSANNLLPSVNAVASNSNYPRYALDVTSLSGSGYQYTLQGSFIRSVTASSVADGALNSITNAQGGTTAITYEPNDYFDIPSQTTIQGGGIRVKQVTESPGSTSTNNIVKNYTYVNPAGTANAGLSSGEPLTLPQFAFTIPYSGSATGQSLWTNATALSGYDLSQDDHTVMYAYTKVSQTGAGSTLYNFNVPATYWNTSAGPVCSSCAGNEWKPTVNFAASYSCPSTNGPIANLIYSYPFAPNPNYDFERGLPIKITSYNDNGNEASETNYTYQRSFTPTAIKAFKSDDGGATNSTAKFYSQYTVFYNTSELPYILTKKLFDTKGLNQAQTTATNYSYTSTQHKLVTAQSTNNSDGSTVKTFYTYIKDYPVTTGSSNAYIDGIYHLQFLNVNAPVETYQTIARSGTTTVTTGGSLTLYSASSAGLFTNYLPAQQFKLVQPDGITSFTPFSINTSVPSVTHDPNYFITGNFGQYDETGYLVTADDNNKHVQTSFLDQLTGHSTAVFKNAYYSQVCFNDFDTQLAPPLSMFTVTGSGSYNPIGSHTGLAAGIAANTQTVSSTPITKNITAKYYIFSIWINPSAVGMLTFSGASSNPTLTYTGTGWSYYEMKIPASALTSTFTLSFISSKDISIDDVLLYPDVSEATTFAFDPNSHFKTAETNTNGVSSYYSNDPWGRILYAFDQDKNIVLRKEYISALSSQTFLAPVITGPKNVYNGISGNYVNTAPNVCLTSGISYTWDFGDNTTPVTTTSANNVTHTYAANGSYTITVTVTSPIFGSKSGTLAVSVTNLPSTRIYYSNGCQPGGKVPSEIQSVTFSQGSTTIYTFTVSDLISGVTIVPGTYTIVIKPLGYKYDSVNAPYGYTSVTYSGAANQCFTYTGSTFTLTDNLSATPGIYLSISSGGCSVQY